MGKKGVFLAVAIVLIGLAIFSIAYTENGYTLNLFSSQNIEGDAYTYDNITFYANIWNESASENLQDISNCSIVILGINYPMASQPDGNFTFSRIFEIPYVNLYYYVTCNKTSPFYSIEANRTINISQNSNLSIWTNYNDSFVIKNKEITFFAEYTNISGSPLFDANCTIDLQFLQGNMTYQAPYYIYNYTFNTSEVYDFTINCSKENYTRLSAGYDVNVSKIFVEKDIPFPDVFYSSMLVTDLDRDGNPDFIVSGKNSSFSATYEHGIYEHDGFFNLMPGFQDSFKPFYSGDMKAFDANNDGYPDIISCGLNASSSPQTSLYMNDGASFSVASHGFEDLKDCALGIIDFNNDGWQDIVMAGDNGTAKRALLYRNTGNSFEKEMEFIGTTFSSVAVADFDMDGYDDIVIAGRYGSSIQVITSIWHNNGSGFINEYNISGVSKGDICLGDMNNDFYLDLFEMGSLDSDLSFSSAFSEYYTNNISGFAINDSFDSLTQGTCSIIDYDNDGLNDFILAGYNTTGLNGPNYAFYSNLLEDERYLSQAGFGDSAAIWYDYDNDSDLDLFISGKTPTLVTTLYHNNVSAINPNNPPSIVIINATYNETSRELFVNWSRASDDLSQVSYHLQIGTPSNNHAVLSGVMSNDIGNMAYKTNHTLITEPRNFVIKVISIDASLQKTTTMAVFDYSSAQCRYPGSEWNIDVDCDLESDDAVSHNMTITDASVNFLAVNYNFDDAIMRLINSTLLVSSSSFLGNVSIIADNESSITVLGSSVSGSIDANCSARINDTFVNGSLSLRNATANIENTRINGSLSFHHHNATLTNVTEYSLSYSDSSIDVYKYLEINSNIGYYGLAYSDRLMDGGEINVSAIRYDLLLREKYINDTETLFSNYSLNFSKQWYFPLDEVVNLSSTDTINITLEPTYEPDWSEFDESETTNFTYYAYNRTLNISNATIATPLGMINYPGTINFSGINLSEAIEIGYNSISVDSASYPLLNTSAILEIRGLGYTKTPAILKDGAECEDCVVLSYDGDLRFNVTSFSEFTTVNNSKVEWNNEIECRILGQQTSINISYLAYNGSVIAEGICNITINSSVYDMAKAGNFFAFNFTPDNDYGFIVNCSDPSGQHEKISFADDLRARTDAYDAGFEIAYELEGLAYSSVLYLGDGFIISGQDETGQKKTYLYDIVAGEPVLNDDMVFEGIEKGAIASADFDNDGDLDILLSGSGTSKTMKLYKKSGSGYVVTDLSTNYGMFDSSIDIADYNNDGLVDILACGDTETGPKALLLKNTGNGFTSTQLGSVNDGTCLFYDIDGDIYPDIIINGHDDTNYITKAFINNITHFIEYGLGLPGSRFSSFALGDIENDGDLDLLLDGQLSAGTSDSTLDIYTFSEQNFSLNKSIGKNQRGSNIFIDFNNDNLIDLLRTGTTDGSTYQPNTTVFFGSHLTEYFDSMQGVIWSSVSAFDYDNDQDNDILISGRYLSNDFKTILYKNDISSCTVRDEPNPPVIEGSYSSGKLNLNWSDIGNVTYNIKIGSATNPNSFYSGEIVRTSRPANPGRGNMGYRLNYSIEIPKQCIIAYVQAVDNGMQRSAWSNKLQISSTEDCSNNYDDDCDGVINNGCYEDSGGDASTPSGSSSSSSGGGTTVSEDDPAQPSPQEPVEDAEEPKEEISTEGSSSESFSGNDAISDAETFQKIYSRVLGHTREVTFTDKTIIKERIKNKFVYPIKDLRFTLNIPKSALEDALELESIALFSIIQRDPIVQFSKQELQPFEEYVIQYEIGKKLSMDEIDSIELNITYNENDMEKRQKEFEDLVNKTAELITINQTIETDYENNKTKFSVDIDFKNESVLYNVSIYQEIPKCLIAILEEEFIESDFEFEIVNEDPIIVWHFERLEKGQRIEFALQSVADENCTNMAKTFAVAKAFYILNKKINLWPGFKDGKFNPGIIMSGFFIAIFAVLLINFTSYTYTTHDKIRLSGFLHNLEKEEKEKKMEGHELDAFLSWQGATEHEINEIKEIRGSFFRKMLANFQIATEELIIFALIAINLFDALEVLPGDLDFIKKIVSWTILSYIFYRISITKLLFGERHKKADVFILVGMFLLSIKNLVVYALVSIQEVNYFNDILTLVVRHSSLLESMSFQLGAVILLAASGVLAKSMNFNFHSVYGLFHKRLKKSKFFRRTAVIYIMLFAFFVLIYNLFFEWLAIAIDAPLVIFLVVWYLIYIFKQKHRVSVGKFLQNLDNMPSRIYDKVLVLFTHRKYFPLGVSGLLILHILTEIGTFILPSIIGKADLLYIGTSIPDYTRAEIASLIAKGAAPIFSFADLIFQTTTSIFFFQAKSATFLEAMMLFFAYAANIFFACALLIIPGIIWYYMFKQRNSQSCDLHKVRFSRLFIAFFIFSAVIFATAPALMPSIEKADSYDVLIGGDRIAGLNIKTQMIDKDYPAALFFLAIILSIAAFIPFWRFKHLLDDSALLLSIISFVVYISMFFLTINDFFLSFIKKFFISMDYATIFLAGNFMLMYAINILFYVGGVLLFFYEIYKMDEIPFLKRFSKKPVPEKIQGDACLPDEAGEGRVIEKSEMNDDLNSYLEDSRHD